MCLFFLWADILIYVIKKPQNPHSANKRRFQDSATYWGCVHSFGNEWKAELNEPLFAYIIMDTENERQSVQTLKRHKEVEGWSWHFEKGQPICLFPLLVHVQVMRQNPGKAHLHFLLSLITGREAGKAEPSRWLLKCTHITCAICCHFPNLLFGYWLLLLGEIIQRS